MQDRHAVWHCAVQVASQQILIKHLREPGFVFLHFLGSFLDNMRTLCVSCVIPQVIVHHAALQKLVQCWIWREDAQARVFMVHAAALHLRCKLRWRHSFSFMVAILFETKSTCLRHKSYSVGRVPNSLEDRLGPCGVIIGHLEQRLHNSLHCDFCQANDLFTLNSCRGTATKFAQRAMSMVL